jgi:hypothetical protein
VVAVAVAVAVAAAVGLGGGGGAADPVRFVVELPKKLFVEAILMLFSSATIRLAVTNNNVNH